MNIKDLETFIKRVQELKETQDINATAVIDYENVRVIVSTDETDNMLESIKRQVKENDESKNEK